MKRAFTMIELVFVIVVIGILASIAIPKLAATRDDAEITKAIATIGAVKSSLATERQKRIIRGDFTAITSLSADGDAFSTFSADKDGNKNSVLESTVSECEDNNDAGCWVDNDDGTYTYRMPYDKTKTVTFSLTNGRFDCNSSISGDEGKNCKSLTQ
ncbi:MAG: prepilin-type N-terminal cleavage/methylation domain-containing protein [Campylobacterales bacterium]|nr:prepilin-type N-terminal cleavage/methylation domain-containing protein [Campylobacterales bacterium]